VVPDRHRVGRLLVRAARPARHLPPGGAHRRLDFPRDQQDSLSTPPHRVLAACCVCDREWLRDGQWTFRGVRAAVGTFFGDSTRAMCHFYLVVICVCERERKFKGSRDLRYGMHFGVSENTIFKYFIVFMTREQFLGSTAKIVLLYLMCCVIYQSFCEQMCLFNKMKLIHSGVVNCDAVKGCM
jgi:hypothetical protein